MPHIPDHVTHDPELVAAYAAGDATGPDLAAATELVASCTECADLHRDLRAIATALPELPPAVRPRDFRITPEQAASLQPSGWRGVLAAFASPRFRLAAPLGTGLAAAGLAGLLLASPGGLCHAPRRCRSGAAPFAAGAPAVQGRPGSGAAGPRPRPPTARGRPARPRPGTLTGRRLGSGSRGRRTARGLSQPVPAAGPPRHPGRAPSRGGFPAASSARARGDDRAGRRTRRRAVAAADRAAAVGPAPVEAQVEAPPAGAGRRGWSPRRPAAGRRLAPRPAPRLPPGRLSRGGRAPPEPRAPPPSGQDMPHIPDHATHDPELVAAYAAGDATGPDLARGRARRLVHRVRRPASRPARDRDRPARAAPRGPPARLPDHARAGGLAAALGLARRARRLRLAPLQARRAPGHGARRRRPRGPAAREPGRALPPATGDAPSTAPGSARPAPGRSPARRRGTRRRPRAPVTPADWRPRASTWPGLGGRSAVARPRHSPAPSRPTPRPPGTAPSPVPTPSRGGDDTRGERGRTGRTSNQPAPSAGARPIEIRSARRRPVTRRRPRVRRRPSRRRPRPGPPRHRDTLLVVGLALIVSGPCPPPGLPRLIA